MFSVFSLFTYFFHVILGIGTPQNFPPPLSAEEEQAAFETMAHGSHAESEEARQQLILHNLRLVSHIVRKYYSSNKNQEDLISIGSIGLCKAVDTFNVGNGTRFATYAAKCIQNEILMHFRSGKKLSCEISINETIDVDRDGNPLTYIDVISSDDNMAEMLDREMQSTRALRYVNTLLDARERQIIVLCYGLSGKAPMTQREIAVQLGISRSYVSRIEKSALEKLRRAFGE